MASDVRVTLGANLNITTTGVEEAKRQAAEVKTAADGVNTSARSAGAAVSEAMEDAAQATRDAADAMRRTAEANASSLGRIGGAEPAAAQPSTTLATRPATETGGALAYDPRTHAHRATSMLHGVESHLAGGVTSAAQLAQLESRTRRAEYYVGAAQEAGLPERQTQDLIEHLEAVTKALEENRETLEESTRTGTSLAVRQPEGEDTPTTRLLATLIGEVRGLGGAGLGQAGMAGRMLMSAGGVLGGAALAGGAAYAGWSLLRRHLAGSNIEAREQLVGMADLGRQYDTDDNPLDWFRQTSGRFTGFTDPGIARLGYSGTQAGAFMARLDLPGGGDDPTATGIADTRTGLEFARATGLQEDAVAGFLRTLGVGGIERGESERALTLIREAMREGVREGVSTSDTFRNMEQTLTGMFRGGMNLTEAGIAFQSGLATAAARSGNRQWQGDQGAANLDRLQSAMLGGGDTSMELMLLNRTGGFSAEQLGLEGVEAENYEMIRRADKVTAGRIALQLARTNPQVMRLFAAALQDAFGDNPVLLVHYLSQFGIEGNALLEYVGPGAIARLAADAVAEGETAAGGDALIDVQRGARLATESLRVRVAEDDRDLGMSLAMLGLTGDTEISMRRLGITTSARLANLLRGFGTDNLFGPYDVAPGRVGSDHELIFDEFTDSERENPGSFSVRYRTQDATRGLWGDDVTDRLSAVESSGRDDAVNMSPLPAEYGGAFGEFQILAANLTGAAMRRTSNNALTSGWDRAFMDPENPSSANVRRMMMAAGFDEEAFTDPFPDDIASQGAEALAEWINEQSPEKREVYAALMRGITEFVLDDFARISREHYGVRDPEEAITRALAAWYMGAGEAYDGLSVLDPDFTLDEDNPWMTRDQSDGGIPTEEHLRRLDRMGLPEYSPDDREDRPPDDDTGTSLGRGSLLTIRFEGLDHITVAGASDEHNARVRDAARDFIGAIIGPASYRGA